jgi:hypothetical protein
MLSLKKVLRSYAKLVALSSASGTVLEDCRLMQPNDGDYVAHAGGQLRVLMMARTPKWEMPVCKV